MIALDGNAIAGDLIEVLGVDLDARIVTEDEAARLQRNLRSLLVRSC